MGKHEALVRSQVEPMLAAGEEILGTVLVNYNGTMPAANLPGSAGRSSDADAQVTFPTARQMALALTGGRLVVLGLGFSGKPKNHIGDVPLSAIDEVEAAGLRFGGVRLLLRSGARVDLEYLSGEPGEQFTGLLDSLVEPRPARDPDEVDLPSWDPSPGGADTTSPVEGLPSWGGADEPPLPPPVMPPAGGWGPPEGEPLPPPPATEPPADRRPPPPAP